MAHIFAIRIASPATDIEPETSKITDVADFVLDNRDDLPTVLEALAAIKAGKIFRGGTEPEYVISEVSPLEVFDHLSAMGVAADPTHDNGELPKSVTNRDALIAELVGLGYDAMPGVQSDWADWRERLSDDQLREIVANIHTAAAKPDFPDISEMVDALREIVAASDAYDESEAANERCLRAVEACRELIAEADAAMDANFGEAS